jgi:hypothetical protein
MENTKKFYAIIRIEKMCCFGIGATPEKAFQRASKRLLSKGGATISNTPFFPLIRRGRGRGGFCLARCTPDFVKAVEGRKSATHFELLTDAEGRLDVQDQDQHGKATRTRSAGQ